MFEKEIINWFKKNKRDLPWRNTDAWGVLVSEFMLQQTPVNRVQPVYEAWIKNWPTAAALAQAPWTGGLGGGNADRSGTGLADYPIGAASASDP